MENWELQRKKSTVWFFFNTLYIFMYKTGLQPNKRIGMNYQAWLVCPSGVMNGHSFSKVGSYSRDIDVNISENDHFGVILLMYSFTCFSGYLFFDMPFDGSLPQLWILKLRFLCKQMPLSAQFFIKKNNKTLSDLFCITLRNYDQTFSFCIWLEYP